MKDIGPGDLVRCVDAAGACGGLVAGNVYRVRSVRQKHCQSGPVAIYLEEILRPTGLRCCSACGALYVTETAYRSRRFVPIDDSALDVFRSAIRDIPADLVEA